MRAIRRNPAFALRVYLLIPHRARPAFVRMFGDPTALCLVRADGQSGTSEEPDSDPRGGV